MATVNQRAVGLDLILGNSLDVPAARCAPVRIALAEGGPGTGASTHDGGKCRVPTPPTSSETHGAAAAAMPRLGPSGHAGLPGTNIGERRIHDVGQAVLRFLSGTTSGSPTSALAKFTISDELH